MAFTFTPTKLPGVTIVEPQVFGDARGFFMETYHRDAFTDAGIPNVFIQDNHSKSKKGVLRGLHFQTDHTQAKLVRVTAGAVLDIVVDLRRGSPTYGQWIAEELSAENKRQLFVPKGCAHGFLTVADDTEFVYKCDDIYAPAFDGGILVSDPALGLPLEQWREHYGITDFVMSDKDTKHPTLAAFSEKNPFVF